MFYDGSFRESNTMQLSLQCSCCVLMLNNATSLLIYKQTKSGTAPEKYYASKKDLHTLLPPPDENTETNARAHTHVLKPDRYTRTHTNACTHTHKRWPLLISLPPPHLHPISNIPPFLKTKMNCKVRNFLRNPLMVTG